MAKILLIDDDEMFCDMFSLGIRTLGHEIHCRHTLKHGLIEAASKPFDIILLDVRLPDGNGLEALPKIQDLASAPEVIIITGVGDPDGAELAINNGVWDYIEKSTSLQGMLLPLIRSLEYREQKQSVRTPIALNREGIIGSSPCMKRRFDLLAQAAASEANVLITGETGTGKELFARAIHQNSNRKQDSFVVVDCAALPDSLIESELFGHKKGAFTGANRDTEGLVLQADGGTLFLDEVSEMPPDLQKAFLRVLQERRFRPVGARREVSSNFRLIAVTNKNLDRMVKEGTFRQDLLYRIRSFVIDLPPLRERGEDIRAIVIKYICTLCKKQGIAMKGFSEEFLDALISWHWPGNVRELLHTLDRVFAVAQDSPTLFPTHLPTHLRVQIARAAVGKKAGPKSSRNSTGVSAQTFPRLHEARESAISEIERSYLQDIMAFARGNLEETCRISGVSLSRLYALLKKYDILKK